MSMEPGKPIRGCHIFQGIDDGSLNQGGNSGDRDRALMCYIFWWKLKECDDDLLW